MSKTRETATADRYQAIPRLAADIASGRAEDTRSFSQNFYKVKIFVKKNK